MKTEPNAVASHTSGYHKIVAADEARHWANGPKKYNPSPTGPREAAPCQKL